MQIRRETAAMGALAAAAVVSVIASLKILTGHPEMFGLDLRAYVEASKRLIASGTPYAPQLHSGPLENVGSNIPNAYLYPPPLAQMFVPLSGVPMPVLASAWALAQAGLLLALLPIVYARYGGVTDRRHVTAILLGTIAFTPNLVAFYVGNVSGWIAIMIALMLLAPPVARSAVGAAAMWLKLTPGAFAIGAFVDRSTRVSAVTAALAIVAGSFVLSPLAWADWIAVLPSVSGFFAQVPWTSNLAPSHVLAATGVSSIATVAAIAVPAGFMALVVLSAWRGYVAGWVAAGTGVYLSATGTSWDHYFAALSPIAVAAWPGASRAVRILIVAVLVWFGPLRFLDTQLLYQLIGLVLWLAFLLRAVLQFNGGAALWRHAGSLSRPTPTLRSQE